MIKHIVSFKLKGDKEVRLEAARKFKESLLALPQHIDCLLSMEVGINCNPEEKWDLVLTAIVEDLVALQEYANHPLHLAAASIIKDIKEDRSCVDYIF